MEKKRIASAQVRGWTFRVLLFIYDALVVNLAYFFAIVLRFSDGDSYIDQGTKYMGMFRSFIPVYTVICLALFLLLRMYVGVWRYAGLNDVRKLIGINMGTCVVYVVGTLLTVGRMPITVYILGFAIQLMLMSVPRILPRFVIEYYSASRGTKDGDMDIPLMIIGVCENTRIIQSRIEKDRSNVVKPVCVVDKAYGHIGQSFNGLPVICGPDAVKDAIERYGIRCAIVADTNMPREFLDEIQALCEKNGIEFRGFVIGTKSHKGKVGIRELLKAVQSPVIIRSEGEEKSFADGIEALESVGDDCVVDSVLAQEDRMIICIHQFESAQTGNNEEWIEKYREETGSDISFF